MPQKMSDPEEPDKMARIAGRDLYGTIVGTLRRVELWRLGNAWGMNFPAGASKDYMLPFFKELEAKGKNPFRPPGMALTDTAQLRTREVTFSETNHADTADPNAVTPPPTEDFAAKLHALPMSQLKKICKMRGIPQERTIKKPEIIARIVAAIGDNPSEQDPS